MAFAARAKTAAAATTRSLPPWLVPPRPVPSAFVLKRGVDMELETIPVEHLVPEEWAVVQCETRKAYGCGKHGQMVVEGLTVYARLVTSPDLTSALYIHVNDGALRGLNAEFGYDVDVPIHGLDASASITKADERFIIFCLSVCHRDHSPRLYYLVYDSVAASLLMIRGLPEECDVVHTLSPLHVPLSGGGYELLLFGRKTVFKIPTPEELEQPEMQQEEEPERPGMHEEKISKLEEREQSEMHQEEKLEQPGMHEKISTPEEWDQPEMHQKEEPERPGMHEEKISKLEEREQSKMHQDEKLEQPGMHEKISTPEEREQPEMHQKEEPEQPGMHEEKISKLEEREMRREEISTLEEQEEILAPEELEQKPEIYQQNLLCVWTPVATTVEEDECLWDMLLVRRFPEELRPYPFTVGAMFSLSGKAFWVDLMQGLVHCDQPSAEGVKAVDFGFIPLPPGCPPDLRWTEATYDYTFNPMNVDRIIANVNGTIRFVCIDRSRPSGNVVISVWDLDLETRVWKKCKSFRAKELWRLWSFKKEGLPEMKPKFPILMPDGTLCLLVPSKPKNQNVRPGEDYICNLELSNLKILWSAPLREYHTFEQPFILSYDFFRMLIPNDPLKRELRGIFTKKWLPKFKSCGCPVLPKRVSSKAAREETEGHLLFVFFYVVVSYCSELFALEWTEEMYSGWH